MRNAILDARTKHYRCIIGGDFNTDIQMGTRAVYLKEILAELGMYITNEETTDAEGWTFRSSMGIQRK